jgi:PAS domain S-box-containing protein
VVLATAQAGKRSVQASRTLERLGNVVLLERPLNIETLTSAVRSALRVRQRQYQARSLFAERERDAEALRNINETLERRVAERTGELEAANAMLRQSETRFRAYFDNFPECLFVVEVTSDGGFLYDAFNPAAEKATGLHIEDIRGKSPPDFMPADIGAKVTEEFRRCLSTGKPHRFEETLVFPTGSNIFETVLVPLHDASGRITQLLGAARDLSEGRALEAQLRQAQKMEAVGQLTGGFAHDFNNILTAISGNLELIESTSPKPVRVRRLVKAAQRSTERGARLTASLLTFSRTQHLHVTRVHASALIHDFSALVRQAVGEAVHLDLALNPALPPCLADPVQLEVAVLNLAINARDAMPRGGAITIETRAVELGPDQLIGNVDAKPGAYVAVEVRDTGTGIPQEILSKVFEPFFTTKEVGKGTGLGLSQVYGFVHQVGGHVTINSVVGHGTVVTMFLPRAEDLPTEATANISTATLAPVMSATILMVEDDEGVLAVTSEMLRAVGHRVVTARDGHEAFAILKSGEVIDLIFSDIVMPKGMSGVELARKAQALHPGIKVLLTSGYMGHPLVRDYDAETEFELLGKPYHQSQLLAQIGEALKFGALNTRNSAQ